MTATVRMVQQHDDAIVLVEFDAVTKVDQDPLTLNYTLRHALTNGRVIDHARIDDLVEAPEIEENEEALLRQIAHSDVWDEN